MLRGMKTRELKAFLKKNGVFVDDCFDMDSFLGNFVFRSPVSMLLQREPGSRAGRVTPGPLTKDISKQF